MYAIRSYYAPSGTAPHARSLEGVWARADDSNPDARLFKYVVAQRFVTLTVSNGSVTRAIQGAVLIMGKDRGPVSRRIVSSERPFTNFITMNSSGSTSRTA